MADAIASIAPADTSAVNPKAAAAADDASSVASAASTASASSAGAGGAGAGSSTEAEARSTELKTAGNDFFKAGHFSQAIEKYSAAIDVHPTAVLYANRAFCYLKTESFGLAINDAGTAVDMDPEYAKAYYRRGSANMALGRLKAALADFKAVCRMKPKDKVARKKFKTCQKLVKQKAFADAIKVDSGPPASEQVDVDSIVVPDSYSGPRLPEDGITLEFVEQLMETFRNQGTLHKKYCIKILKLVKAIVSEQKALVRITVPATTPSGAKGKISVCGDTHGQYYDLLNIFKLNGNPSPDNPYLFNGDFVDRGSFSVENVLVLFAWKALYPNHFFLSRGNHETINMNKVYGFEGEVKHKYDMKVMAIFTEVFQSLPLAHLINGRVFVVHGGLPGNPKTTMSDVEAIDRFREPPDSGATTSQRLMSDLLWSDPQPFPGVGASKRGIGVAFGPDITKGFCEHNGLDMVIRSHEVKEDGYVVEHEGRCVTVFSAPNYCDQMGNRGAVVRLDHNMKPDYLQFSCVPHPPIKPMAYASGLGMFGL